MFNVFAMDSVDRDIAIAEKTYEIAMAEVAYMEAMIDARLRINMAKSELKIMTEGTEETAQGDLVYLFNEAGKDAEAQGEGLFTKIKNALVSFFTSTWNAIQKIFTGKNTQKYEALKTSKEKVKIPFNVALIDAAEKVADECERAINNPKDILGKIGTALGIGAAIGEGVHLFKEYKKGYTPIEIMKPGNENHLST